MTLQNTLGTARNQHWAGSIGLLVLFIAHAIGVISPAMAGAPLSPTAAEAQRRLLLEPGVPVLGSPTADVTVIEYFDYNCPFCKELAPAIHPLISGDHAVAVVYKEWPIFGGVSVYAAKSALAANFQGKYLQAHDALFVAPRLAAVGQVDAALAGAGIDMKRLHTDLIDHREAINQLLTRNDAEARGLGLHGTPGVVVAGTVVKGVSDLKSLQAAVDLARKGGGR